MAPLLELRDLCASFFMEDGEVQVLNHVSFSIEKGETAGLVGESGCGKSVTALAIMRLITRPGQITGGQILFDGQDLMALPESEMRKIRGNNIAMIFQEPMTSLNPVFTVGEQIAEAIRLHQGLSRKEALQEAARMLETVAIPDPQQRIFDYPHQMSGGMRQRVMIAMALSCKPLLLIADEPTTALDVTIQAQILDILRHLQEEFGLSVLLITHNLGLIAEMTHRIFVMYTGKIVEEAPVRDLFKDPMHPYTSCLLQSIPMIHKEMTEARLRRLYAIKGQVPDLAELPDGCHFAPRCPEVMDECWELPTPMFLPADSRRVRCLLHSDHPEAAGGALPPEAG